MSKSGRTQYFDIFGYSWSW